MKAELAASVVLIALAVIPPRAATGVINGVVVDEHQKPVAGAQVHAFSARRADAPANDRQTVPFSTRADGSATTDADGRFQIDKLAPGEYVVAARPPHAAASGAAATSIYATTFYPATIDAQTAVRVPALDGAAPIRIELVRVTGARVTGSVTNPSGRTAAGMNVRLFYQFAGYGSEPSVATVGDNGAFEIAGVPPGWYRLTVAPRETTGSRASHEFATRLIEVQGTDVNGVSLVMGPGGSVSGRVVAEPGAGLTSAVGLRVTASRTDDQYYFPSTYATATVASDWSFRMTGLSGAYQFTARGDRAPFVNATRVTIDGRAASEAVDLTQGTHEVVVFVAPRETPAPAYEPTLSTAGLVEQFRRETPFFRQFATGQEIVRRHDLAALSLLADWLGHDDRHVRGNVAFVFAGLGDPRGFETITQILADRSDRPEGQGIPGVTGDGKYHVAAQIRSDRYYAAHLLGDLRDPRGVAVLVPLLKDKEVRSVVPWALAEIGDARAVGPLIDALDEDDPSARVMAIYALETLKGTEAIPRLTALLEDRRPSTFGAGVTVAEAATAALAKLRR